MSNNFERSKKKCFVSINTLISQKKNAQVTPIILGVYADDIVLITQTEDSFRITIQISIKVAKNIRILINKNNTKCMIVFRRERLKNAT